MDNNVKQVIGRVANALQVINVLSTRLRQDLGESPQQAFDLEGDTSRGDRDEALQPGDENSPATPSKAAHIPDWRPALDLPSFVPAVCRRVPSLRELAGS
jgi:hypothetical protein